MHSVILSGEFVRLRPLVEADAELTLRWRIGERARLLNRGAQTLEGQRRWIADRPATEFNFIIELASGLPVGMLALCGIDEINLHAEPGRFLIGEEDLVKGVPAAVEAMLLLYRFAFDTLGLQRVWGIIADSNRLMVKWQKYLGMREEGRLRRHLCFDGQFCDAVVLGMLVDEYRTVALPRMQALLLSARSKITEIDGRQDEND